MGFTHLIPSLVLWLLVAYRVRVLRAPGGQRALWFALACCACGETLSITPVWDAAGRQLGAGIAAVVQQAFTIGAAYGVLVLLRGVTGAGGGRRRLVAVTAAALVAMSVPLLASRPTTTPVQLDQQAEVYTSTWGWITHWSAVLAYLGWSLIAATRLCAHYSRHAAPGPLRTGLRLVGAGTTVGMTVVALRIGVLVAGFTHDEAVFASHVGTNTESILLGVSLLLIALGSGYEALARLGGHLQDLARAWRSVRRLRPLWQALYAAVPYIALTPGAMSSILGSGFGAQDLLYRRVVEIRDGLLALAPTDRPACASRPWRPREQQG